MTSTNKNEKLLAGSLHESIFHTTGKQFKNTSNTFLFAVIYMCAFMALVCIMLVVISYLLGQFL